MVGQSWRPPRGQVRGKFHHYGLAIVKQIVVKLKSRLKRWYWWSRISLPGISYGDENITNIFLAEEDPGPLAAVKGHPPPLPPPLARAALSDSDWLVTFLFRHGGGTQKGNEERTLRSEELGRRADAVFYGSMAKNESMEFGAIFALLSQFQWRRIMIRGRCNSFQGYSFLALRICDADIAVCWENLACTEEVKTFCVKKH